MKRLILLMILVAAGVAAVSLRAPKWLADRLPSPENATKTYVSLARLQTENEWIAAYGRVEPSSEERNLAFEISGVIATVEVLEGDPVTAGQQVASLRAGDRRARLEAAKAQEQAKLAQYQKLVAGARKEEKSSAWAAVKRAETVMKNLKREMVRRQELLSKNLIAKEEVDRAIKDYRVAEKQYEEAEQQHLIAQNQSRKEDIASSYAEYDAARHTAREMVEELEKTVLRSPIDGTVLRTHRKAGENVSIFFEAPVLTVGNEEALNVRAEVDEDYAVRVKKGQEALFVCDAFPDREFMGTVTRLSHMTGRKLLPTDTPGDKVDTKVLEVIVSLNDSAGLITGITGDVLIRTGAAQQISRKSTQ